ncbi:hypothetical protein [Streptomyces aidingensis]|uniref:Extradiol ring-cleavage dioxygenase LigAB LigA subunit domain-containing protein n=1 Tax=Streptomyces aidingensis TaxID=910347 RepID=A0A1I1TP41_9ACTN|nr:hypothetical protein [Streptomyces aidingensis]SFD60185.1 hypothetical protein SAMN05421773_12063 [Streptomyces aidingensis]
MSALREVLHRSNHDLRLRTGLRDGDPDVLTGFDLTEEEASALLAGDENALYRLLGDTKYFFIRENGNYDDDGLTA